MTPRSELAPALHRLRKWALWRLARRKGIEADEAEIASLLETMTDAAVMETLIGRRTSRPWFLSWLRGWSS